MSTVTIAVIVAAVIVVAVLVIAVTAVRRRRRLQQPLRPGVRPAGRRARQQAQGRIGAGRTRTASGRPGHPAARRLSPGRLRIAVGSIQEQFVDTPEDAVASSQLLVVAVMSELGYPAEDPDQMLADLSVEHATTLDHYRAAEETSRNAAAGTASTEDLRLAMIDYRALFRDLVGEPSRGRERIICYRVRTSDRGGRRARCRHPARNGCGRSRR